MKTTITLFAIILLSTSLQAKIWRVNNNPSNLGSPICDHCFVDLQEAVNSILIDPTDTIHVEASATSYGGITISQKRVIIGVGYYLTDNPGEQANSEESILQSVFFDTGSNGSVISGLSISATFAGFILFQDNVENITVTRCRSLSGINFGTSQVNNITITKNYLMGSVGRTFGGSTLVNNITLLNNYIGGNIELYGNSNGICLQNVVGGNVNIQSGISAFYNNICTNSTFPIAEQNNSSNNIYNNIFVADAPTWLSDGENVFGMANTSIFPVEGSEEDKITTLPFCTSCETGFVAGGANNELMGVYGGLDPYRRAGIPSIPSIYGLQSTNQSFPGGTLNVIISTKSNQ